MSFQIKSFNDIVLAQINHARSVTTKVTDFLPGSVVRTLMEAPAVEMEELYLQMFLGLRDAIPVATFLSFGFDRLAPKVATGFVSISRPAPVSDPWVIFAGTIFTSSDGRDYPSSEDVTWEAADTIVHIPVSYPVAGLIGNASAGAITSSPTFDTPPYTISNQPIETGRDAETDDEREARFADFIASLSRGTVTACMYAARQSVVLDMNGNIFEYVVRVGMDEQPGIVKIYLYSSQGVPSAELLADGQLRLDGTRDDVAGTITPGYRSAGVKVFVLPMVERSVGLSIKVGMFPGYTLNSAVEQQLEDIFSTTIQGVRPGTTLYLGTIVESMLAAAGVEKIVPVTNSNVICATDEALIPGTLTVAAL
jgi:hypothetical protein